MAYHGSVTKIVRETRGGGVNIPPKFCILQLCHVAHHNYKHFISSQAALQTKPDHSKIYTRHTIDEVALPFLVDILCSIYPLWKIYTYNAECLPNMLPLI